MEAIAWIILFLVVMGVLNFNRAVLSVWAIGFFVLLILVSVFSHVSIGWLIVLWILYVLLFGPLLILPFRRRFITAPIFNIYRKVMPSMSTTEREALSAGNVGWEAEIFTGQPDWGKLHKIPKGKLTEEECAFLRGPVETLCGMISNWNINHKAHKIPDEIWVYLKKEGFLGLSIPKKYGGKEFSALAHSQIITKVASVSIAVGVIVSVPNSLGPAELLHEYGTEEQKDYFLPRLVKGEEIPCFALTSPIAGSDASSIEDHGVVVKKKVDGKEIIGIELNWNKRYITLAPVATIIGLAFKLYDPDHLLGDKKNIGITCALIPATTKGVVVGRQHFPLCSHFPNGPTQGNNVFIPLDYIIGGEKMKGSGWRMLMECLAAGRSISLPAMSTGGVKRAIYATGAYARIRRQFKTYIGAFGGIQEALARIVGYGYLAESCRLFSVASIDRGVKSAVSSAICKYHVTEFGRFVVNEAMDVHGGKGICMGGHNYIAQSYIEAPISITVEGANILTRSMIIFGQGAIRCHPYILKEMNAAKNKDTTLGLQDFDKAIFRHLGMMISNKWRAFILAFTSGFGVSTSNNDLKRYCQHFSRFASAFSFVADVSMFTIGGKLKRKERLSARLGDMLSLIYMGCGVVKYYDLEQNREALPVAKWACEYLLFRLQNAFDEFFQNLPNRWLACCLRCIVFPLGKRFKAPNDRLSKKLANLILEPTSVRKRLTHHLYTASGEFENPIGDIEEALVNAIKVEPLIKRMHVAKRDKLINGMDFEQTLQSALKNNILSEDEVRDLRKAQALRLKIINVDDFSPDEFLQTG